MQQHRKDAHGAATVQKGKKPKASKVAGAPVSTAVRVQQQAQDSALMRGVDRLVHVEDVSRMTSGSVVADVPINAGSFARLSVLSSAFQRVVYRKLVFRVETFAPTSVGGGYVAAFVADADDLPPAGSMARLNWVTSQSGSITTKWWQAANIAARPARAWYYTSPGIEIREYCPGRLIILVDSKATATCGLTVYAEWEVSLTHATLESVEIKGRTVAKKLYTQNGHKGLFYKDGDAFKDDVASQIPGAQVGDVYELPYPISVVLSTDTERLVWWIKVTSKNDLLFCLESPNDTTDLASASETLFLKEGTYLPLVKSGDSSVQGNLQGPLLSNLERGGSELKFGKDSVESSLPSVACLQSLIRDCQDLIKLQLSREGCTSSERCKLTECLPSSMALSSTTHLQSRRHSVGSDVSGWSLGHG